VACSGGGRGGTAPTPPAESGSLQLRVSNSAKQMDEASLTSSPGGSGSNFPVPDWLKYVKPSTVATPALLPHIGMHKHGTATWFTGRTPLQEQVGFRTFALEMLFVSKVALLPVLGISTCLLWTPSWWLWTPRVGPSWWLWIPPVALCRIRAL
jgi:hypothetical protein